MTNSVSATSVLNRSLELPCGSVIKNRLIKSAMSDSLANGEGDSTNAQAKLYERWAEGGIGLSVVGEVQVDYRFPERPGNLVLHSHSDLKALQHLASCASVNGAHIWPQLSHAGGLSHSAISQPKGPSALEVGSFHCEGMSLDEISQLPAMYANAALIAKKTGFTGVQIHAGHGFILSQFLSPLFNHRQDKYGGSVAARCRIVVEVIAKVREVVGASFPIGIKINTTDQIEGGLTEADALKTIGILDDTSVDLIELSGGTYFPGAKSSSDRSSKGPYFVGFAEKARKVTKIPLVVTGGFKTRQQADSTLESDVADFIGLARALVLKPDLANTWMHEQNDDLEFPRFTFTPQGGVTAWYTMLLTEIAHHREKSFDLDLHTAIAIYEERDDKRITKWLRKFNPSIF